MFPKKNWRLLYSQSAQFGPLLRQNFAKMDQFVLVSEKKQMFFLSYLSKTDPWRFSVVFSVQLIPFVSFSKKDLLHSMLI